MMSVVVEGVEMFMVLDLYIIGLKTGGEIDKARGVLPGPSKKN